MGDEMAGARPASRRVFSSTSPPGHGTPWLSPKRRRPDPCCGRPPLDRSGVPPSVQQSESIRYAVSGVNRMNASSRQEYRAVTLPGAGQWTVRGRARSCVRNPKTGRKYTAEVAGATPLGGQDGTEARLRSRGPYRPKGNREEASKPPGTIVTTPWAPLPAAAGSPRNDHSGWTHPWGQAELALQVHLAGHARQRPNRSPAQPGREPPRGLPQPLGWRRASRGSRSQIPRTQIPEGPLPAASGSPGGQDAGAAGATGLRGGR